MSDRYGVFGNPVRHSRSPAIHAAFAAACHQDLVYEAVLAPLDGFARSVRAFVAAGGRGANVTLPFKQEAGRLATRLTERARLAGAVNTLSFDGPEWLGDNTDGAGLLCDLRNNLGCPIADMRVLLLGAGGAARGVLGPLLEAGPRKVVIANRTEATAHELAARMANAGEVRGCSYAQLAGQSFDLLINATSASVAGASLPLPDGLFASGSLAYDMMYGDEQTPFLRLAGGCGAARLADGLGMLVEQAAEAFCFWRGVRPATAPVLAMLRSGTRQAAGR